MRRHILVSLSAAILTIPPVVGDAQVPLSERPGITVTVFEFGTIVSQLNSDVQARRRLERLGVRDGNAFAEALGTGAADLIVEKRRGASDAEVSVEPKY